MIWDNLYARQYEFKSYYIKYLANWHKLLQLLSITHAALNKLANIIAIPCLRGGGGGGLRQKKTSAKMFRLVAKPIIDAKF